MAGHGALDREGHYTEVPERTGADQADGQRGQDAEEGRAGRLTLTYTFNWTYLTGKAAENRSFFVR